MLAYNTVWELWELPLFVAALVKLPKKTLFFSQ